MKREHACEKCLDVVEDAHYGQKCECGGYFRPTCEKSNCHSPATKSIYGLGYLVSVCEAHYREASQRDKDDAIRFRQAER